MHIAITGATGLLGGNLAIQALAQGHRVTATRRATSDTSHLSEFDITWVEAPLSDREAMARAFEGARWVFHCAAAISVRYEVAPWVRAANVDGTRHVVEACRAAGVERLVHCSTVSVVGISEDGAPCDEASRFNMPEHGLDDAYVQTKRAAQQLVLDAVAAGEVDAVVVNPAFMLGPYDAKPSSGELIVNIARGRGVATGPGDSNFVDVRDVARGMLRAAERGRVGQCYILGGHNMTYREAMTRIAEVAGAPAPRLTLPGWALAAGGKLGDVQQRLTGRDALFNSAVARWASTRGYQFSSARAVRELGYEISPLEPAIRDALAWFRARGMI